MIGVREKQQSEKEWNYMVEVGRKKERQKWKKRDRKKEIKNVITREK